MTTNATASPDSASNPVSSYYTRKELTLSVVMPVYNEAVTVEKVIRRVLEEKCVFELVVVDDCSKDGTWGKLTKYAENEPRLKIFRHDVNQGKGGALHTGFAKVTGEVVLIQDADLEYTPDDYVALLEPIWTDKADVVFGSRFSGGGAHRVLYFWHSVANKVLTLMCNMACDLNLTDMECGFKIFRTEVLRKIDLKEKRFGFEPEVTCKTSRLRPRIYEVPVSYFGRTFAEGKKITWRDGVSALRCIIYYGILGR